MGAVMGGNIKRWTAQRRDDLILDSIQGKPRWSEQVDLMI